MTFIDIINQPYHKRQFGMIVRLYRIRQQHSLRTLSERSGISHAYLRRIEKGQVNLSEQIYDHLTQTLNIEVRYDPDEEKAFFENVRDVFNNILYFDSIESEINMNKLEIKAAYHEQSLWMVDFLIIKIAYYNFMMDMDFQETTTLYRELNTIRDLFDPTQLQAFLTYAGTYFFNVSDYDGAMSHYKEAVELNTNTHLSAFNEYLIARTHMLRHHYSKAMRNLKRAHEIFKTYNNYVRISHTRILLEIMKLMTSKRNDPVTLYKDSLDFAKKHKLRGVEAFIHFTFSLYHYQHEEYEAAIEKLHCIDGDNMQYAYYEGMNHLKLGNKERALKAVRKGRKLASKYEKNALLYKYGLDMIESYFQNGSDHQEDTLSRFYEQAKTMNSFTESKDAYRFYVSWLEKKRRYKKAYNLANEFTDLTLKALH